MHLPKSNHIFLMCIFLFGAFATILSGKTTHKIKPLANSPGIYFERIQDLYYTEIDWKVLIFIDITLMQYHPALIIQTIRPTRKKCVGSKRTPSFAIPFSTLPTCKEINNRTKVYYHELISSMKEAESIDNSMPSKHMKRRGSSVH